MGGTGTDSGNVKGTRGYTVGQIRKAIAAGFGAATVVYGSLTTQTSLEQPIDLLVAAVAGLAVGVVTFWIPNDPS